MCRMSKGLVAFVVTAVLAAVTPAAAQPFPPRPELSALPDIVVTDMAPDFLTADTNLFLFTNALDLDLSTSPTPIPRIRPSAGASPLYWETGQ